MCDHDYVQMDYIYLPLTRIEVTSVICTKCGHGYLSSSCPLEGDWPSRP